MGQMSKGMTNSPLGEIIVYEPPDGELRVKDTERFLKDRGHEIRP